MTEQGPQDQDSQALPDTVRERVALFIEQTIANTQAPTSETPRTEASPESTASAIFDILTGRRFSSLGRKRTAPFWEPVTERLATNIRPGEPVHFYYDVGPGYHASLRPGIDELTFTVGLSELLILSQIASFRRRVSEVYAGGVRFNLVIDNLCGLATNGVAVDDTTAYCADLRSLISATGMSDTVGLTVESEAFSPPGYELSEEEVTRDATRFDPSPKDVENVERFLGRRCSVEEAAERMARYELATATTERLLAGVVKGVRMTQRATSGTLGFRPFSGGDSRTQCGQVVLTTGSSQKIRPVLLTSQNVDDYVSTRLTFPDALPPVVSHVTYSERRDG